MLFQLKSMPHLVRAFFICWMGFASQFPSGWASIKINAALRACIFYFVDSLKRAWLFTKIKNAPFGAFIFLGGELGLWTSTPKYLISLMLLTCLAKGVTGRKPSPKVGGLDSQFSHLFGATNIMNPPDMIKSLAAFLPLLHFKMKWSISFAHL